MRSAKILASAILPRDGVSWYRRPGGRSYPAVWWPVPLRWWIGPLPPAIGDLKATRQDLPQASFRVTAIRSRIAQPAIHRQLSRALDFLALALLAVVKYYGR